MMAFDPASVISNPSLHYLGLLLSIAVFFVALTLRSVSGNILRPVFTALVVFALLSAFQPLLYLLIPDKASVELYSIALSYVSLVVLLIAFYRMEKKL